MDTDTLAQHGPDLFAKVGPLPVWAWGAMVVGGYIYYNHSHARGLAATSPDAVATTDGPTVQSADGYADPLQYPQSAGDAGYNYGDVLSGQYTGTVATSTTQNGGVSFASNQAWATYAIQAMIRQGFPSSTVVTAITHYLAGSPLSTAEQGVISSAITNVGPPPLPLPVIPLQTPTGSAATPGAPVLQGHSDGTRAQFTWSPVTGAVFYIIYHSGKPVGTTLATKYSSSPQRKGSKYGPISVKAARTNRVVSGMSNSVTVTV